MVVSGCRSSSSGDNEEFHDDELLGHNISEMKGIKTLKQNYPMVKSYCLLTQTTVFPKGIVFPD